MNLNPGQKVTAIILHADVFSSSVDISLLPALVAKKKSVNIDLTRLVFHAKRWHNYSKCKKNPKKTNSLTLNFCS